MKRFGLLMLILGLATVSAWSQAVLIDDFNDQNDTNELGGTNASSASTGSSATHVFYHITGGDYALEMDGTLDSQGAQPEEDWIAFSLEFAGEMDVSSYAYLNFDFQPFMDGASWYAELRSFDGYTTGVGVGFSGPVNSGAWVPVSIDFAGLSDWPGFASINLTYVTAVDFGVSRYDNETLSFPLAVNGAIDNIEFSTTPTGIDAVRTTWSDLKTLFKLEP